MARGATRLIDMRAAQVEFRTPDRIDAALLDRWQTLADRAVEPNIFFEPALLLPALTHLRGHANVTLFLLWTGVPGQSELAGLMPMGPSRHYRRWPFPHISNWKHDYAFLGSPLVQPGAEQAFWEMLIGHSERHYWGGFLHIWGLPLDGPLSKGLRAAGYRLRRRHDVVQVTPRALLTGPERDPDRYYAAAVRAKKRKELRRQRNRLEEEGVLTGQRTMDTDGLDAWLDEFLTLEQSGWKGAEGTALASTDRSARFFREAMTGAAARGQLQRIDLRLDGVPIAMLINLMSGRGGFSFKTAFDERYARLSPGVQIQLSNLENLRNPQITWIDSCAARDHPMIDSLWVGRRPVGSISINLKGRGRLPYFCAVRAAERLRLRLKNARPAKKEEAA